MRTDCGGCQGEGAHWRWCPEVVGAQASRLSQWGQRAEDLADEVGSNDMGAANQLYHAGAMLKASAEAARKEFQG